MRRALTAQRLWVIFQNAAHRAVNFLANARRAWYKSPCSVRGQPRARARVETRRPPRLAQSVGRFLIWLTKRGQARRPKAADCVEPVVWWFVGTGILFGTGYSSAAVIT